MLFVLEDSLKVNLSGLYQLFALQGNNLINLL